MKNGIKIIISISVVILFWLFFFSFNTYHHISIKRNWITGTTELLEPGFTITAPWVQIIRIDIRPVRVCIECSCRNAQCNLIAFNKEGWQDFLAIEGFRYYWLANRLSFNFGNSNEYRGMSNILRGYGFDDKQYSFITKEKSVI